MEPKPIDIIQHIYEIGAHDHKLAMRELKPLASLGFEQRTAFWPAWQAVAARRRAEIARAMVDLAEDNVDLDFGQALIWLLDDDDAEVRASAAAGLWENERPTVLRRLIELLHDDPAPAVRAAAATSLGRAAYHAQLDELDAAGTQALRTALERLLLDPRQPSRCGAARSRAPATSPTRPRSSARWAWPMPATSSCCARARWWRWAARCYRAGCR